MFRWLLGIPGSSMEPSRNGYKIPILIFSQIIKSLWSNTRMQIFISLIHGHCGVCGRFYKTTQRLRFLEIRPHRDLSELQCCCLSARILMWLSIFHLQDWTENVIIIVMRWLETTNTTKGYICFLPSDQCAMHVRCLASACSRKTFLNFHEFRWWLHRLPTWNHPNSSKPETVLSCKRNNFFKTLLKISSWLNDNHNHKQFPCSKQISHLMFSQVSIKAIPLRIFIVVKHRRIMLIYVVLLCSVNKVKGSRIKYIFNVNFEIFIDEASHLATKQKQIRHCGENR